ncbi:ergothioneine biosynthesis protein EgtB [Marinigracilibium pacificum]|uniref:Ergothioneine biosynthesis protein EgtB n=1 Tax=Marinigracilibium pacificum TaxID=2729599 RepID=A0A848IZD3_9BACT|nr:ergothioneine biosynthesis protein EgtB [Marinigracilibium pacificum]NMM48986.1 ergothioneine biosynthesis protein EgtB [Marinigracilibium pacificum]
MEKILELNVSGLSQKYLKVRDMVLELTVPLKPGDFYVKPNSDHQSVAWHMGHTTWFFEYFVLRPHKKNYEFFRSELEQWFNTGLTFTETFEKKQRQIHYSRPSVGEIIKYRNHVDQHMLDLFENDKEKTKEIEFLIHAGISHELSHIERMLNDIKFLLGSNPFKPIYHRFDSGIEPNLKIFKENYLEFDDGIYEIGSRLNNHFSYDNERGKHNVYLDAFQVLDRLVLNGEYVEFMEAGGYDEEKYWTEDGWLWVKKNKINSPLYWEKDSKSWYEYTLRGYNNLNPYEPLAHISYYEAEAYARWRGKRLLTEFEWEVACRKLREEIPQTANFLEKRKFHPQARVEKTYQFYGDCWEWTSSPMTQYPGYVATEMPLGKFMRPVSRGQVLRGGSSLSSVDVIRNTCRLGISPTDRFWMTGLRLAEYI